VAFAGHRICHHFDLVVADGHGPGHPPMSSAAMPRTGIAWQKLQAYVLLSGGMAAIPVLYFANPGHSALFPPCPFRLLTGWLCPGCGSLRATHQLLHGDFVAAFALNPLMVLLLPLMAFLLAQQFLVTVRPGARERILPASVIWGLLFLTLAYAVARNLPGWPVALSAV
jgi:uncharacterized protein DUF2752